MPQAQRRADSSPEPAIAEARKRARVGVLIAPAWRQPVAFTDRARAGRALEHPVLDQKSKPTGESCTRHVQVRVEVDETMHAEEGFLHHQKRPRVAEEVEDLRE